MASTEGPLDPARDPWNLLGYTLRVLRHEAGESLTDTAGHLHVSRKSVSHWEHAYVRMEVRHCQSLDARWNTGGLLELLHTWAKDGRKPNVLAGFSRFEAKASALKIFQCSTIPGLLQTPAYARMVLIESGERDVERHVEARLKRQEILSGDQPPHVAVILDERVLNTAPSEIMRDQIEHLVALGEMQNVIVRVVPDRAGWYVGLQGPFQMITSQGRNVVYVEGAGGGRLVLGSETEDFNVRWERIGARALPWDASRDRLISNMEGLA